MGIFFYSIRLLYGIVRKWLGNVGWHLESLKCQAKEFSNLKMHLSYLEVLLKYSMLGPSLFLI